jgi:urea transport system ATP-binding protein
MLEVHKLSAAYGQSEVLHSIDLSAKAGEIVALVGRNGMGKSTLMKSLIGVMPARSGKIVVDGTDVAALPSYQRVAHGLAYVPQGRQIFGTMTVRENIETGLVVTGKTEIPSEIYDLFPILADFSRRRGGNLSGGQQQQLAIARALAKSPARWPATRKCSCWMSRRRVSSRRSSRIWRGCYATSAASATSASLCANRC